MGSEKSPGAKIMITPGLFISSSKWLKKGGVRPPPNGGRTSRGFRQLPEPSGSQTVAERRRTRQGPSTSYNWPRIFARPPLPTAI